MFEADRLTFGIDYLVLKSPDWGLNGLMAATETGLALPFPAVKEVTRIDLQAANNVGQLAVYVVTEGPEGLRPFSGCVLLEKGGVCLSGILLTDSEVPIKALERSLKTVREIAAVAVPAR